MVYCGNCGAELKQDSAFCEERGAKAEPARTEDTHAHRGADSVTQTAVGIPPQNGSIHLCADGKYRWIYEFSMLKNPVIFFTIMKVLVIGSCVPALITILSSMGTEGAKAFLSGAKVLGILLIIMVPLLLISYFIVAALYGWKYIVLFEMDEKGIRHIQQDKQFKKAQGIAWVNMFLGAAGNNISMTGHGMALKTRNTMSSDFAFVKKVTCITKRNTIKPDELFAHNQIYIEQADWEFVRDYIVKRCVSAKIK